MEKHDILYFRHLWQTNVETLENLCESWEGFCGNPEIPDEVIDEIHTTVGLSKLLMNQKLKQFKGLMDDSEFKTGEKEITCIDLEGFWDMVYFEVEKILKSFNKLDKCKENGWKFVEDIPQVIQKKKLIAKKVPSKIESSKSHALAAKQRLADAKKKMLAHQEQNDQIFVEISQPSKNVHPDKNTLDKKENVDSVLSSNVPTTRKSKGRDKQTPVQKISCSKVNETPEQITPNEIKLQSGKENFLPQFSSNNSPKVQKISESNEKTAPRFIKKTHKDYGKLQCLTRSAKKALAEQNNIKQS